MKITLQIQENVHNLMRRCGYFSLPAVAPLSGTKEGGELVFIRPLTSSGSGYPRFHIYVKFDDVSRETLRPGSGQALTLNLHLDQKKPVYQGVTAHSGEYEGEIVEKETARIKQILGPMVQR